MSDAYDVNKQIAATMIIRFFARSTIGGKFQTLSSIAKDILEFEEDKSLTNFLDGRTTGASGDAKLRAQFIVDTARDLFEELRDNRGQFEGDEYKGYPIPGAMTALYENAFGDEPGPQVSEPMLPHRIALDELADHLANTEVRDFRSTVRLKNAFADRVYDVYRWTSPSQKSEKPRAIRAALQFLHPSKPTNFLQFHIHYKPYELDVNGRDKNHSKTTGVVVPIGEHIYMVGSESNTLYPLVIAASVDNDNPQEFRGLVLRRADRKNDLFSARVIFRQNQAVSNLSMLDDAIGIIADDNLTPEEQEVLSCVKNVVFNDGKQALSYLPLSESGAAKNTSDDETSSN